MTGSLMKAQKNAGLSEQQKGFILNTWYESPKESKGDTLTFSTVKHVSVAGTDVVGFEYSKITFTNATDFNVAYWTKCAENINMTSGKWNYVSGSVLLLDFIPMKYKNQLTVIEVTANKLKVVVK
jgi:hypothetical protein